MVTLRVPLQRRPVTPQARSVRRTLRGFETALYDLPGMNRLTIKLPPRRRTIRLLVRRPKTQQWIALALVAGGMLAAGILIGYRGRRQDVHEDEETAEQHGAEEAPDGLEIETISEEHERAVLSE